MSASRPRAYASAVFATDAADEEAMAKTLTEGIYTTGLAALRKRFG